MKYMLKTVYDLHPEYRQQSDANEFLLWFVEHFFTQLETKDLFLGKEEVKTKYKCKHQDKTSLVEFRGFILKTEDIQNQITLQNFISQQRTEVIENVVCETCKAIQEVNVTKQITHFPKTLNIQLFLLNGNHLTNPIHIPFEMSFVSKNKQFNYVLKSLILYSGNSMNGHYACIVNNGSQWVLCNDEMTEEIDEETIQKYFQITEIVIYEKKIIQ